MAKLIIQGGLLGGIPEPWGLRGTVWLGGGLGWLGGGLFLPSIYLPLSSGRQPGPQGGRLRNGNHLGGLVCETTCCVLARG